MPKYAVNLTSLLKKINPNYDGKMELNIGIGFGMKIALAGEYYNTMNNIKLNIKRLGPVADTEIKMAPFMIFTGSSNLGKSYVNFLTYYVMSVFSGNRIAGFLRSKISDKTAEKKEFTFSFTLNEICKWMEQDVKLFFQYLLNYPNVPCEVSFEFETEIKDFKVRINELDRLEGIYGGEMPIIVTKINE